MFSVTKKFSSICKDIADVIRNKMGIDTKIKLKDFPDCIEAIEYNTLEEALNSSTFILKYWGSRRIPLSQFYNADRSIEKIIAPNCQTVADLPYSLLRYLTFAFLPNLSYIMVNSFFKSCYSLTSIALPVCNNLPQETFADCYTLSSVYLSACSSIASSVFQNCYRLTSLYLAGSSLCQLNNINAFSTTPLFDFSDQTGKYGSIFVPASLLTAYQSATNWAICSSCFAAMK